MINERTERNEVMGVVLFESTSVDRLAVKQAFADSRDMDDSSVLVWCEVDVKGRG